MLRFPVGSPSARPLSPSPSAVEATRVKVRWSIWQTFTQGVKAGLLLVVVDHEDGEVVHVTVLPSLRQTFVLLNKDQVTNLKTEDTEGVDGMTVGVVPPVGHCNLIPSPSLQVPNVPDSPIEVLVIWLYSQGPGRNVAAGWALLTLGPAVGGGVVTI